MKNKFLFGLAIAGVIAGIVAAWPFGEEHPPQAPAFQPAADPYANGIYATGIIESE